MCNMLGQEVSEALAQCCHLLRIYYLKYNIL